MNVNLNSISHISKYIIDFFFSISYEVDIVYNRYLDYFLALVGNYYKQVSIIEIKILLIEKRSCVKNIMIDATLNASNKINLKK